MSSVGQRLGGVRQGGELLHRDHPHQQAGGYIVSGRGMYCHTIILAGVTALCSGAAGARSMRRGDTTSLDVRSAVSYTLH